MYLSYQLSDTGTGDAGVHGAEIQSSQLPDLATAWLASLQDAEVVELHGSGSSTH